MDVVKHPTCPTRPPDPDEAFAAERRRGQRDAADCAGHAQALVGEPKMAERQGRVKGYVSKQGVPAKNTSPVSLTGIYLSLNAHCGTLFVLYGIVHWTCLAADLSVFPCMFMFSRDPIVWLDLFVQYVYVCVLCQLRDSGCAFCIECELLCESFWQVCWSTKYGVIFEYDASLLRC